VIIDISYHQRPENIDYDKIASQIDGAILRAAYGTGAPGKFEGADPAFETHYNELHSRGIPVGAYHYITEYQDIDAQAKLFLDTVRGKEMQLGYWCDVELEDGAERLTAKSVIRWMELVEAEVGRCGIYTGRWTWKPIMGDEYARFADRPLWMSAYTASPEPYIPHGWERYDLWQYTSSGRLDGYTGNLDMSKRGTMADILLNITPLSQKDPRWGSVKLGTSNETIGGYGCLITSASMMLRHFGFDTDPGRLNDLLKANGGYHDGNLFVWGSLEKIFNGVKFGYRYNGAYLDKVDAQLQAGKPVIVNVDMYPATSALDEHWVLIVGKVNGSYIINDPWYGTQFKFEDKYGAPSKGVRIVCTYNFDGAFTPPEPETALYRVKINEGVTALRIRSAPVESPSTDTGARAKYPQEYDVFEERDGYGRIGAGRWIALEYTQKLGTLTLEERVTALEKAVFG